MEKEVVLSKDAFDMLVSGLLNMEEGKRMLFDDYFPNPSKEREEIAELTDKYLSQLEKTVSQTTVGELSSNEFPYVVVGCQVTIQAVDSSETYDYRIISPLSAKTDFRDVSYLSPMGKALLLKRVDDIVSVEAPGGVFNYRIVAIKLLTE